MIKRIVRSLFLTIFSCYGNFIVGFNEHNNALFNYLHESPSWQYTDSHTGQTMYGGQDFLPSDYATIGRELRILFKKFSIKVVLDVPCYNHALRDCLDTSAFDLYIGVDHHEKRVRRLIDQFIFIEKPSPHYIFKLKDVSCDVLDYVDAILCHDYFTHLSFSDIKNVLNNFKISGAKYLILETYPYQTANYDLTDAIQPTCMRWRPLNFQLFPFNFPEPCAIITLDSHENTSCPELADPLWNTRKTFALWEIDTLIFS